MPLFELAALGAAAMWALTGIISTEPSRALGAIGFSRVRMSIVFVMLALAALATSGWSTISEPIWGPILLSGFIGIFVGDTALFLTLNRLGPRATSILFAANAPIAVLLGWVVLSEALAPIALLGVALAFAGIVLAILYGRRSEGRGLDPFEATNGPLSVAIVLGLTAALCQAIGTLIARPVMSGELTGSPPDPVAVSAIRVGIAAVALHLSALLPTPATKIAAPLTWRLLGQTTLSGFLAMGVGMTLLLFALEGGKVGIVSTLSATTPVLILPLLWFASGQRPTAGAWVGATLTVIGSALIFTR